MLFFLAMAAMASPFVKVKVPRDGSVASYLWFEHLRKHNEHGEHTHFMLLAGVIWPNMVPSLRIAVYAASVSSLLSVAVPK